jgi:carbohydrate-binding DOMON domain-containing protein
MAGQVLNPRKVLVVYRQDTDGTWRADRLTVTQGAQIAAGTTSTGADLDTVRSAVYAAISPQTILQEITLTPEYP